MRRRRRRSFEIWSTAARHIAGACLACRMSERLPTRVKTAEMRQDQEKRDDDAENRNAQQATSHHERCRRRRPRVSLFFLPMSVRPRQVKSTCPAKSKTCSASLGRLGLLVGKLLVEVNVLALLRSISLFWARWPHSVGGSNPVQRSPTLLFACSHDQSLGA